MMTADLTPAQMAVVYAQIDQLVAELCAIPEYVTWCTLLDEVTRHNDAGVVAPSPLHEQYLAAWAAAAPHVEAYTTAHNQVIADALREACIIDGRA